MGDHAKETLEHQVLSVDLFAHTGYEFPTLMAHDVAQVIRFYAGRELQAGTSYPLCFSVPDWMSCAPSQRTFVV